MGNTKQQELKQFFEKEIQNTKHQSRGITSQTIDNLHIKHQAKEQQLVKLLQLKQSLENDSDDESIKDYILFTNNNKILFDKFYSRYILENKNDIEKIKKAIIVSDRKDTITKEINTLQSELPPFQLEHYLANNNNIFFYEYCCCPPNTSAEEYYKMREDQLHSIINCIQKEVLQMKTVFNKKEPTPGEIIQEIEFCMNHDINKLIALNTSSIPKNIQEYKILTNPRDVFKIHHSVLESPNTDDHISPPEIFNISLNKYLYWLQNVSPLTHYNFNKIFSQEFNKERKFFTKVCLKLNRDNKINELVLIKKRLTSLSFFHKKVKCHVIENAMSNKHHLKALFFWNLLFSNNINESIALFKLSMKISLLSDFYLNKLSLLPNHICSYSQALNFLTALNADSHTSSVLINSIYKSIAEKNLFQRPIYSIIQDIISQIKLAVRTSIVHLDEVYNSADQRLSALHAVNQHNHIQGLMNKLSLLDIEINDMAEPIDNIFTQKIEHYSNIKLVGPVNISVPTINTPNKPDTLSFNYKRSNTESLLNFIKYIDDNIDFLTTVCRDENENITSPETFVDILTSNNLLKEDRKVFLKCNTNQFKYIIKKLDPLFDSLSFSNIERSKAFFSRNNNLIKTSNLTSSNCDTINVKVQINEAFKRFLT